MASTTTSETENRILDRVRALLAKAESTTFAEEAAALTAKAHELMATHAIDMAMIQQQEGQGEVIAIQMFIPGPYVKEKFLLLAGVARGSRCRAILGLDRETLDEMVREQKLDELMDDGEHATVVGYRSDLDVVELLFTSLLLQAVNVMLARGVVVSARGQNRTKSFRRSFLIAFAYTIGDRLRDTESRVTAEADRVAGGGVLPVLASRRRPGRQPGRRDVSQYDKFAHIDQQRRRGDRRPGRWTDRRRRFVSDRKKAVRTSLRFGQPCSEIKIAQPPTDRTSQGRDRDAGAKSSEYYFA